MDRCLIVPGAAVPHDGYMNTFVSGTRGIALGHRDPSDALRKLRPAKLRRAIRRRWFEFRISHMSRRPAPGLEDLGSAYGGWIVPTGLIGPSWTCYSVGAGGDVSFDLELAERFDATVRAVEAVPDLVELAIREGAGESRFSAHHAAVAPHDGPLRMQVTHDRQSRSVSPAGLYESDEYVEVPGRTLESLMGELGDDHIDLLKLDIEGGEYELLPMLDMRGLGISVFATQLHHTGSVREARSLIAGLKDQGYELVGCRPAVKLTFVASELLERPARALHAV
jgi:FkbM family methyltransferase